MMTIRPPDTLGPPPAGGRVVSIGVFDGVHQGHRRMLRRALALAQAHRADTVVLTFWPHPLKVLAPHQFLGVITTLEQRLERLDWLGVDRTWVVPFTKRLAQMSARRFVDRFLIQAVQPTWVVVGEDFRFGRYREAGLSELCAWLRPHGITTRAVRAYHHGRKTVSSSLIRQLILAGHLKQAGRLLGSSFAFWGKVVKGRRRGRRLGFPTANLHPRDQILPPPGVYASLLRVVGRKGLWPAVTNMGRRPTFETGRQVVVETHVPDFASGENLYGEVIEVFLMEFLRPEEKFYRLEDWRKQVARDVAHAVTISRRRLTHPAAWMQFYL